MNFEHPIVQNALAAALASTPAMVAVVCALWQHNKRVDDLKEVMRAELLATKSELRGDIRESRAETREILAELKLLIERLDGLVQRLEDRLAFFFGPDVPVCPIPTVKTPDQGLPRTAATVH